MPGFSENSDRRKPATAFSKMSPAEQQKFLDCAYASTRRFQEFFVKEFKVKSSKDVDLAGILGKYADPNEDSVEMVRRARGTSDYASAESQ